MSVIAERAHGIPGGPQRLPHDRVLRNLRLAVGGLSRCIGVWLLVAIPLGLPLAELARAQGADTASADTLTPGVVHRRLLRAEGPWRINVLEVDLRRRELSVESAHALDTRTGLERTSDIARRVSSRCSEVLGAVNADFFDLRHRSGETENSQARRGEVLRGLPVTESPFDSFDNVHTQLAITVGGRPMMDRFVFDGAWMSRWGPVAVSGVNTVPHGNGLVLFTPFYGAATPRDTSGRRVVEVAMVLARRRGDTAVYRVQGPLRDGGGSAIPARGAVLAGYGELAASASIVARSGQVARFVLSFAPSNESLATLVGGWPRLLRDGVSVADSADALEGTFSRFSAQRHPRTAAGFSRDSATLYLVTVDGRSENSGGATLVELAELMRSLGAHQAMNLDGGGSTTMVVRGAVVNVPSDTAGERSVGNALLVMRRARSGCGTTARQAPR